MSILRGHLAVRLLRPVRYLCWWHNPMHRRTDGIESLLAGALLVAFLVALPVAASVGRAMYAHGTADSALTRAQGHWVTAVLLKDARSAPTTGQGDSAVSGPRVPARWRTEQGRTRVGTVQAMVGDRAGTALRVWLDGSGAPTTPPATPGAIVAIAVSTGLGVVIAVSCLLELGRRTGRWLLDRRRLRDWETEWRLVEPQWTRPAR